MSGVVGVGGGMGVSLGWVGEREDVRSGRGYGCVRETFVVGGGL